MKGFEVCDWLTNTVKQKCEWDCEIVRLWDCETVRLWDCGIVRLWDCETVRLWDCEIVRLWDCETVRLWDCEIVRGFRWMWPLQLTQRHHCGCHCCWDPMLGESAKRFVNSDFHQLDRNIGLKDTQTLFCFNDSAKAIAPDGPMPFWHKFNFVK